VPPALDFGTQSGSFAGGNPLGCNSIRERGSQLVDALAFVLEVRSARSARPRSASSR
jgi:hypothetical protein